MFSLMVGFNCFAQTHLEYISEPTDSMALISKQDIDIINNVFTERNMLDSLCSINEELISKLELNNRVKSVVLERQVLIIKNNEMVIKELEARNENSVKYYSKELKKEKNKKISFQALTGASVIAIILLILL
jgi:hypothetical protein